MPKITIVNEKKEIEVQEGANLRKELRTAGVPLYRGMDRFLNCRGLGLCGTCWVLVKKGMENISPKSGWERFRLGLKLATIGNEEEIRLACLCSVKGDCTIETRTPLNLYGENFWQKPFPFK